MNKVRLYNGRMVATEKVLQGVFLGVAIKNNGTPDVMDYEVTDLGKHITDNLEGNVDLEQYNDSYYLRANKDIERGDFISLDFDQAPEFFLMKRDEVRN